MKSCPLMYLGRVGMLLSIPFKWNQKSQPVDDIDKLEPFHTTELKHP